MCILTVVSAILMPHQSAAGNEDLTKAISEQLRKCWKLPGSSKEIAKAVVVLRWKLKIDGTLNGDIIVEDEKAPDVSPQVHDIAVEAAIRAVKSCAPFKLPAEKYEVWKSIAWAFDPRESLEMTDAPFLSDKYRNTLLAQLAKVKVDPHTRKQGTALIRFQVFSNGKLGSVEIKKSSNHDELDAAALLSVNRAAPFPMFPKELGVEPIYFIVPYTFKANQVLLEHGKP